MRESPSLRVRQLFLSWTRWTVGTDSSLKQKLS